MNLDGISLLKELGQTGHKEQEFDITKEFKITLRTLTSQEETSVYSSLEGLKGVEFLNRNKIETLARSIVKINEIKFDINDDLKAADNEKANESKIKKAISKRKQEMIDKKIEIIIESWPSSIVDSIFTKYASLTVTKELTDEEFKEAKKLVDNGFTLTKKAKKK